MPQHCSEIVNGVWLPGQIDKDMPSLRQFHEKDSGQSEGWCCTMMSGEMHLSLNLVRSLFIYLFTRRMMEKIVRSWDPTSLSLSSQGQPRRKIKPTCGVFVIVRAAWSCSNIAPCFTRALKTLPIPAGPIIWTDHSVMHCSEKRENMRDDHCDCLWLIIKTQGHIGLAGSPASASFYPGECDDSDGGTAQGRREQKQMSRKPRTMTFSANQWLLLAWTFKPAQRLYCHQQVIQWIHWHVGTWTCGWAMEVHQVDHILFLEDKRNHRNPACPSILQVWQPYPTITTGWLWRVTLRSVDHIRALLSLCCPSCLSALTSSTLFSTTPKESQLQLTVSDSLLTKAAMLFFLTAATWEPTEDLSRYCKTSSMANNWRFSG